MTPLEKAASSIEIDTFEKLYQHNQGALFFKDKNSSKEWKRSIAEYFYRYGAQHEQKRAEKLVEALKSMHIDTCGWDLETLDIETARGWHVSNNEKIEQALKDYEAGK